MPLKLNTDTSARDVLDFSKLVINSREDLEKTLEKIPDYRNRPEKIRLEDLRMDEKNFSFNITKPELEPPEFEFACPIPAPLHEVKLEDIRHVDINWHMLTELRPETKIDGDIFNRIVQLERVTYKTVLLEQEQAAKTNKISKSKKVKSKTNVKSNGTDERSNICRECGDEFCNGSCQKFLYEEHERIPPVDDEDEDQRQQQQPLLENNEKDEVKSKKKFKKKKKKIKTDKLSDVEKDKLAIGDDKLNPSSKKPVDTQRQSTKVEKSTIRSPSKSTSTPNIRPAQATDQKSFTKSTPRTLKIKQVKSKSRTKLTTKKTTSPRKTTATSKK